MESLANKDYRTKNGSTVVSNDFVRAITTILQMLGRFTCSSRLTDGGTTAKAAEWRTTTPLQHSSGWAAHRDISRAAASQPGKLGQRPHTTGEDG
ncbi:hypothetical protein SESBI_40581 [Sesbania bispinosa]|nr:hypothetical protein SESBI_40581 [Sesbania bispinosa]